MESDPTAVVLAYLDAFEKRQFDRVAELLDPDLDFQGPGGSTHGAEAYLTAIKRLGLILLRNAIVKTFADGNDVCVIYDFVTDTPAGAVPSIEWHTIEAGRIRTLRLYFDRVAFAPVREELARRASS